MVVKTWMFVLGVVALVVSAAGIVVNLGFTFWFLAVLPINPIVYLAIDTIVGLALIGLSLQRTLY